MAAKEITQGEDARRALIDDEEYLIMREDEFLGILVGKKRKVKV